MADEMILDANRSSTNLGIDPQTNQLPDMEMHTGSSRQFVRMDDVPGGGRSRRSPGDGQPAEKPAPKSVGPDQTGNIEPPRPIRSEDFARGMGVGHEGGSRSSPGNAPYRAPVTPETALFGAAGARFDFGQLTPVDVGSQPNKDTSRPRPVGMQPDAYGRADVIPDRIAKTSDATAPWGPPHAWSKEKQG